MRARRIIFVFVGIAAIALLALVFRGSGEPHYYGKPLSYWVKGSPREGETRVVPEYDTNAIPYLLDWMQNNDYERPRPKIVEYYNWLAARLDTRLVYRGDVWKAYCQSAFGRLGTNSAIAIPPLTDLLKTNDSSISHRAAEALAYIGAPALPALRSAFTNENPTVREQAAFALLLMGDDAKPALPDLNELLHDPDSDVRATAQEVIEWIEQHPSKATPVHP